MQYLLNVYGTHHSFGTPHEWIAGTVWLFLSPTLTHNGIRYGELTSGMMILSVGDCQQSLRLYGGESENHREGYGRNDFRGLQQDCGKRQARDEYSEQQSVYVGFRFGF